jgi:hypothetical protein
MINQTKIIDHPNSVTVRKSVFKQSTADYSDLGIWEWVFGLGGLFLLQLYKCVVCPIGGHGYVHFGQFIKEANIKLLLCFQLIEFRRLNDRPLS